MTGSRTVVLRLLAAALAIALLLLAPLGLAAPAQAHASLVASTPEDGATLEGAPTEVALQFSGEVRAPAYVVVTGPAGDVVDGDPVIDGDTVTQPLGDGIEGGYTIAYRVVSEDGHPISGQLTYQVGTGGPAAQDPAGAGDAAEPGADATQTVTADLSAGDDEGWWQRHGEHVWVFGGLLVVAAALLAVALRREQT
ncbi:copper resistance protein CopC [Nocardioides sp. ChNu-153]|uniref:copper resistance CopC family protein n=1 Tax=unclassified Nocardioides TaxID=2615069 RepID=UPI002406F1A1|nr:MULTISPECIES: copper resistance CopC family protein [unclassified Nocardioides]MDF9716665.1 copper resistance protein CopC [Nocardioides sp. ChNu-99]MDN7123046.1 copper resistance protein CopC [Nocardioides sp. ChNu-153]